MSANFFICLCILTGTWIHQRERQDGADKKRTSILLDWIQIWKSSMPTRFITSIIKEWELDEDQYRLQESKQILLLRWEQKIYLDRNDKGSCEFLSFRSR